MNFFLALQHTYQKVEFALFQDEILIEQCAVEKFLASKLLLTHIEELLKKHAIVLDDIDFIVVNQGPGPFTTMRIVITIANALAFAKKVPLVGVDGIKSLVEEYSGKSLCTVGLLNAFSNDVYFAIKAEGLLIETGYEKVNILLEKVKKQFSTSLIKFVGNASYSHRDQILSLFGRNSFFSETSIKEGPTIKYIGLAGYKKWLDKIDVSFHIQPLYLKKSGAYSLSRASQHVRK
jgi:tRNA threonylcarbamoyladenosine biosynthesis protein TsaB